MQWQCVREVRCKERASGLDVVLPASWLFADAGAELESELTGSGQHKPTMAQVRQMRMDAGAASASAAPAVAADHTSAFAAAAKLLL